MRICFALLIFLGTLLSAQSDGGRWEDHFSYKNVTHVLELNGVLYCASENGIFLYDPATGEVQKNSKVNDLNEVGISAMAYNQENDFLIIGYSSGELDFLGADENFNFLEVPLDDFQGDKQINHISTYQNSAVLSGEFGVVTFSLERLEFDETAFFTTGGQFIPVNETVVRDGIIYAATESGIFSHPLDDFIPNFGAWVQPTGVPTTGFRNIELFGNDIFANTGNVVYRFDGTNWSVFQNFTQIVDIVSAGGNLNIVRRNAIAVFDGNLSSQGNLTSEPVLNTIGSLNNTLFLGTTNLGLVNAVSQESFLPSGPDSNNSYGVTATGGQVFIAPGAARNYNQPQGLQTGYYHFNTQNWIHNSAAEMNGARDIIHIAVNPTDSTEVWASTWSNNSGLFQMRSGELVQEFNTQNSLIPSIMRLGGATFDMEGNLYVSQSFVLPGAVNGIYKRSPEGQEEFINLTSLELGSGGVNPPVVDRDGLIYVPGTRGDALQVTNGIDFYSVNTENGSGSLPSDGVLKLALDRNNVLWIATREGLRIFRNRQESLESGTYDTVPIVIEENGIGEELFRDTLLSDIEVDGANNKWICTNGSGVFYISADGQQTIFNFTTSNSPLPSNNVFDASVDLQTGRVYFATDRGVVSYQSDIRDTGDSFGDVLAFPNPVRPGFQGNVTIRGLAQNADVRIVDVVGNLIFRGTAEGGVINWNQRNQRGRLVASGIYLVLMTNSDASETATTKIAIVR